MFRWTVYYYEPIANFFNINVSELCIVLQFKMAEVLAASNSEDEKKRFTTSYDEQFKNTFVQERCQTYSKGNLVSCEKLYI